MIPRATYRLQLNRDFTFADARRIVPYLDDLGISHIYVSPITTAAPGSTHGYDVVDPTAINPELGGIDGLRALVAALRERGMGLIIDIVPNHMGVAADTNACWMDVLQHGRASALAPVFDIDWGAGPIVLPVLGDPLETALGAGDIRVIEQEGRLRLRLYEGISYPFRRDDATGSIERYDPMTAQGRQSLRNLLGRQHYRLAWWRAAGDLLNWRRFFAINELAAVRVEDPQVFELTHALYFDLWRDGLIDGVRVDHIDGVTDPAGYCRCLRARFEEIAPDRHAYVVLEKILAADEHFVGDWPVEGTSGYDFMRDVAGLLHAPDGIATLTAFWQEIDGRAADFGAEAIFGRRDVLAWQFEGQLTACVRAFASLARSTGDDGLTHGMLRRAIERLLWVFPVYRTYGDGRAAPVSDAGVRETARSAAIAFAPPGEVWVLDWLLDRLAGTDSGDADLAAVAVARFQQLSAPIAAKGIEDTAFYRYGALLSLNDVGFDPAHPTLTIAQFHAAMTRRAADQPHALLATATHDHKRGEDARARLAVLSAIPDLWRTRVQRWLAMTADGTVAGADGVHPGDRYVLFQTLVGAWRSGDGSLLARVQEYQTKALREGALRSSWAAPDVAYEARCHRLAANVLHSDGTFVRDLDAFVRTIGPAALANTLAQTGLRLTLPGVPDCYQGCELLDLSMVDPDNRRPVDYAHCAAMLREPARTGPDAVKQRLIAELLGLRRAHPALFAEGDYRPLAVSGPRSAHILAFARHTATETLTCAVAIRLGAVLIKSGSPVPTADWWADTTITTDGGTLAAADAFAASPVYARQSE